RPISSKKKAFLLRKAFLIIDHAVYVRDRLLRTSLSQPKDQVKDELDSSPCFRLYPMVAQAALVLTPQPCSASVALSVEIDPFCGSSLCTRVIPINTNTTPATCIALIVSPNCSQPKKTAKTGTNRAETAASPAPSTETTVNHATKAKADDKIPVKSRLATTDRLHRSGVNAGSNIKVRSASPTVPTTI